MTLLSTSDLIKKYGLDAKKSLGQNFILDKNFTDKIARTAGDLSDFVVLEIGAGPGSLSRSILDAGAKKLIAIEKDRRCLEALNELKNFYGERFEIIEGDALEIDESQILNQDFLDKNSGKNISKPIEETDFNKNQKSIADAPIYSASSNSKFTKFDDESNLIKTKFKIIANLPYNIGTALVFKWLKIAPQIASMHLMLQKEVVQRIVAKSGEKHYGRLAVMINFLCHTKMVFLVNNSVFTPPPKVTSAIVEIIPRVKPLADVEFEKLEKVVAAAFNQRRKMLRSSLKSVFGDKAENVLQNAGIKPDLRAENLTIEEFCQLARQF